MKTNFNRREFVRKSAWGAATTLTLPAFLQQSIFNLDARAQSLPSPGGDGPILVVVELGGGNDTLNTVIPFANSTYQGARPSIAFNEDDGILNIGQAPRVIGGNENVALHPSLSGLNTLWQEEDLAIINGVGYPNPNLSHFTSFDYWHSARPNSPSDDGWIGRYFSSQCSGCDATQAIEFASRTTTAFTSSSGASPSVSFESPNGYGWRNLDIHGRDTPLEELYRKLIGLDHSVDDGIDSTSEALSYVQRSTHNAMISTRNVRDAVDAGGELQIEDWPNSGISRDLQQVAQLIRGGMDTSIYYVHQGGYDTHNNQTNGSNPLAGRHFNLLTALNGGLDAFAREMKLAGLWDRVVILTFSEFGRKVIENGSSGTDHGAAESLFVMGGPVNGGQFFGQFPDLDEDARVKRDSLDFNVDFRTVYRSLLQNWMGVPASAMPEIFPSQPANFDPIAFV